tara:strand:- start:481 stop:738 length:258 start_codon:yes stop_codon:yes gene_type:complete
MKVINVEDQEVVLTELEQRVYNSVKDGEMDDCHASSPFEVSECTGIPMKQMRGIMTSLEEKGICYIDELVSGCGNWIILFEAKES